MRVIVLLVLLLAVSGLTREWPLVKSIPSQTLTAGEGPAATDSAAVEFRYDLLSTSGESVLSSQVHTLQLGERMGTPALMSGLRETLKSMKVGEVRQLKMGSMALDGGLQPPNFYDRPHHLRLTLLKVYPKQEKTVKTESGNSTRKARLWDTVDYEYELWAPNFQGDRPLSSGQSSVTLAHRQAVPGVLETLVDCPLGESRKLVLPYYLFAGYPQWSDLPVDQNVHLKVTVTKFHDPKADW